MRGHSDPITNFHAPSSQGQLSWPSQPRWLPTSTSLPALTTEIDPRSGDSVRAELILGRLYRQRSSRASSKSYFSVGSWVVRWTSPVKLRWRGPALVGVVQRLRRTALGQHQGT